MSTLESTLHSQCRTDRRGGCNSEISWGLSYTHHSGTESFQAVRDSLCSGHHRPSKPKIYLQWRLQTCYRNLLLTASRDPFHSPFTLPCSLFPFTFLLGFPLLSSWADCHSWKTDFLERRLKGPLQRARETDPVSHELLLVKPLFP